MLGTVAAGAVLFALLLTNGALLLREYASMGANLAPAGYEETGTVIFFALVLLLLLHFVELPFPFYQGYVLEHRYGLSNQSLKHWVADQFKGGLLGDGLRRARRHDGVYGAAAGHPARGG